MTTLRTAIRELPRFPDLGSLNVSQVAAFMGMDQPTSIRDLLGRINRLPPSMTLTQPVVTGAALGGTVTLTIDRDGGYTFSGSMRATGFPSFQYTVLASVRSDAGVTIATRHTGRVYGTDTPGNREDRWSQTGTDAGLAKLLRNTWPLTSHGTLTVTYSEELAGTLGTAVDILKALAEFVVGAATLGSSVACCLLIGSELHDAGINLPGLGGIVGLTIVAGAVFIYGPFAVVPATIAAAAAGAIVDSMVKIRSLDTGETAPTATRPASPAPCSATASTSTGSASPTCPGSAPAPSPPPPSTAPSCSTSATPTTHQPPPLTHPTGTPQKARSSSMSSHTPGRSNTPASPTATSPACSAKGSTTRPSPDGPHTSTVPQGQPGQRSISKPKRPSSTSGSPATPRSSQHPPWTPQARTTDT